MAQTPMILVAGKSGQVARALQEQAGARSFELVALGRPELDITDAGSIAVALDRIKPDLVINAAAYTAVDQAESDEANAMAANRDGPLALAKLTAERGLPLLHISTDYVFDGRKETAYTTGDAVCPLGVYGKSKLAGEVAVASENPRHYIFRTSWVYSPFGGNFVKTMLRLARDRDELGVVDDQRGNPTSAHQIADGLLDVSAALLAGKSAAPGVYHMTAGGTASWAEFADFVLQHSENAGGPTAIVNKITSAEFPTPVERPKNSALDCSRLNDEFGVRLGGWETSAATCVSRLLKEESYYS